MQEPLLAPTANRLQRANSAGGGTRPRSTGKIRTISPAIDVRRGPAISAAAALNQPPAAARQKDKFVPLSRAPQQGQPPEPNPYSSGSSSSSQPGALAFPLTSAQRGGGIDYGSSSGRPVPAPTIFEDLDGEGPGTKGRITAVTVAEGLDRKKIEALLKAKYPKLETHTYQDVVHATPKLDDPNSGDIFFFDYGTVVFWGISAADEQALQLTVIGPCKLEPLDLHEIEIDEFTFHYSTVEPPHIQNDVITLNKTYAADHQVKLAISHALAQSTLLGCYEERLQDIVEVTRDLPEALAEFGRVQISRKQVARLIGQVFLQRSAVNLLGVVLDVPEFFWSAPDHLQVLHKRVCEYLELDTRVEVLNTRYGVLQEMLEMVRDHQNNQHMSRLEWIVIWLIVAAVVIGCLQVAGLIGFISPGGHH
ncbi:hypothetical protein OEZ85_002566 [Tetradesmus obliquus]|uniref:DUF155 domain-containing protein n=1 Tax=Tetradesmus obliquus TaxID=3088 RepID=A0ABY8TY28_TETOB|nr:hypothetical protein OEZ85_002566 [Tetradesmus obliquus]